jgi:peptidoglycan hydrolase CwlO-like protein
MKTEMETALSKLQTEKDGLAAQIKTLTSDLDKAKADLAAAVKDRDGLQEQIKKLTGDQTGAVAEAQKKSQSLIDDLKAQLAALTSKFTDLQGQNGKLQATIKDLQDKLKNVGTNLIPKQRAANETRKP